MHGADQSDSVLLLETIGVSVVVVAPRAGNRTGRRHLGKPNLRSQNLLLSLCLVPALMSSLSAAIVRPKKDVS
jgi:hypothetical protein